MFNLFCLLCAFASSRLKNQRKKKLPRARGQLRMGLVSVFRAGSSEERHIGKGRAVLKLPFYLSFHSCTIVVICKSESLNFAPVFHRYLTFSDLTKLRRCRLNCS